MRGSRDSGNYPYQQNAKSAAWGNGYARFANQRFTPVMPQFKKRSGCKSVRAKNGKTVMVGWFKKSRYSPMMSVFIAPTSKSREFESKTRNIWLSSCSCTVENKDTGAKYLVWGLMNIAGTHFVCDRFTASTKNGGFISFKLRKK